MNIENEYEKTNIDEIVTCRICLDDDKIEKMISPCLCRGTNKYVHIDCLNQWRCLSYTEDSATKCPTCKFDYVLEIKENNDNILNKKLSYVISNPYIFFLLNILSLFLFLILSYIFIDDGLEENEINIIEIILIYVINSVYFILFIIYFFTLKNRKIFFDYYKESNFIPLVIFFIAISSFITTFLPMIGFFCFSLTINFISTRHLKTIKLINDISIEKVLSLEDDSDLLNV